MDSDRGGEVFICFGKRGGPVIVMPGSKRGEAGSHDRSCGLRLNSAVSRRI